MLAGVLFFGIVVEGGNLNVGAIVVGVMASVGDPNLKVRGATSGGFSPGIEKVPVIMRTYSKQWESGDVVDRVLDRKP